MVSSHFVTFIILLILLKNFIGLKSDILATVEALPPIIYAAMQRHA